jgi:hypothetical protein
MRSKVTGERYLLVNENTSRACAVPLDIARLAAGKDAWLRQVVVKCSYCDNLQPVGETESGTCCQKCFDDAGRENELSDSGKAGNIAEDEDRFNNSGAPINC